MKHISTPLIGITLGIAIIVGAYIYEGGSVAAFFLIPAISIVLGGTLAATLAGTTFARFLLIPSFLRIAFAGRVHNTVAIIEQFVEFNALSRREGFLILRDKLYEVEFLFFRKMLRLCVDGMTVEQIHETAHAEMESINERHLDNIALFKKMAGYSPTMGIIGTVVGLITTLGAVNSNPAMLIQHIALAFIATLWGILLANMLWLPIAERLTTLHNEELRTMRLVLDGITALLNGSAPSVTRATLASVLPSVQQDALISKPLPVVRIAPIVPESMQ
ncbi:MAG: MotA/TolQ/ExbB proton channel family protein [Candidatus Kapabacteria bacterium]|nr:MotA/TolQ/ExbB proton channel family protein [Candidatus Kapabacteria bacterium]